MKDNFSTKSADYKKFRPDYPDEIYDFIRSKINGFDNAWDCGTGNGQVAGVIADFFTNVAATDISENQIKNAVKKSNIKYSIQPAEKTTFKNEQFDLIISAQAAHWFEFDKFYSEVKRCLKPDGLVVLMGYGLFTSNPATNELIADFYDNTIGAYWDPERKYLDEHYHTIPFPFKDIKAPPFFRVCEWDIEHLLGYLRTWSAVNHYEKKNDRNPVSLIEDRLRNTFGKKNKIVFPILLRLGKIEVYD
ncbi:class I SAM-dependent methyltransferase [Christiangramia forsetii]|uniref:SAM-dependent methyltransferase n=2 Tax=Christiangramia forsetii TaxID=411153 RepID=A0M1F2_CHRFK|nr:class I SAM-dependent methyltransferase [Christiangramia forsetii]GGG42651.1 methyltransferase [Christiangramia forsetii]CAL66447.1 SAM-dependent methyltransferase [Christiangramia forsetii KT0803]